eukprot:3753118-Alexandrium_andersonii.AAC.1
MLRVRVAGLLSHANTQHVLKRSEPELRGPRSDLEIGPPSSRGVHAALLRTLSPMVATRSAPAGPNIEEQ